ncbi:MAG: type I polyketide synthase [Steroidobacteraceae bacterium]
MTNNRGRSPVAIVGVSFRLPGANGEALWDALLAGRDLVSSVEADRWAQDALIHPNKGEPGTSYTFAAGSIGDVAGFDAAFFGISPREAEQMDPQQRILLEMAWEAFEQAGIPPSSIRGSRCGVYVGLSSVDYAYRRADDLGAIDSTTMTGSAGSIAANRLSYLFDLRGPSMVIDTACSSALVAFHQACQSIRSGETDAALVGGISLHLHPYGFVGFSKASMLSRQGRCSVFDAHADGYVRAEGGGVLILKPLTQALADGNRILAVVAATGVNSDGRKSGLTVPSHLAQAALLREVYGRAGISPADIDYYEAHGTGTAVGDPVETRAIGEALGQERPRDKPLPVGSIKGNVGHLEAAAGIAGLVKALFVLRDRLVPGNVHLRTVNPNIDFSGLNLAPVVEPFALAPDGRLVVGVSAFGFGGTNAHVVLKSVEGSAAPRTLRAVPDSAAMPLLLSARDPAALRESARRMSEHVRSRRDLSLEDIVYSAATHRDLHAHRLTARAADRPTLAIALDRFAATGAADGIIEGKLRTEASAPAFIYSGNGSQWAGMGLQLLEEDVIFRDAVTEVDAIYARVSGESILAELRMPVDADRFSLTEVAQPALFAMQVGLTRMLEHHGVLPIAVCGHSVGEVAAAWACGALSLSQAVRVVHARSTHQSVTRGRGCMTAATLGCAETEALLATLRLGARLEVAAINSAHDVTVAGDTDAMTRFEQTLAGRGVAFRRLALDYAFHSAAMNPIRAKLLQSLHGLESNAPKIPMYSTVTGVRVVSPEDDGRLEPSYWWRNVREPVKFEAAVRAVMDAGINTFIEIGPHAVLTGYLAEITKPLGAAALVLPSLTRRETGIARILGLIANLQLAGSGRQLSRVSPVRGRYVDLPHYPWQRERYWLSGTAESQGLLTRRIDHPLLGYGLAGESLHWENHLDVTKLPAYADHAVGGGAVFPAAGYVEMALAAAYIRRRIEQRAEDAPLVIEDLEILAPLALDPDLSCTVRLRVDAADGRFTVVGRERASDLPWRTFATGRLVDDGVVGASPPAEVPARTPDVSADDHYEFARLLGLDYGPAFRTVNAAWYRREGVFGVIATPAEISTETQAALLHPAYLDGAFQLLADLALRDRRSGTAARVDLPAFLPVRIGRFELLQPHARVSSALAAVQQPRQRSRRSIRADFTLYDAAGAPVAQVHGVRFRAVELHGAAAQPARWLATRAVPKPHRDMRAVPLPSSVDFARHCALRLHAPARLTARRRFSDEIEPLFDALCASFTAHALRALTGDQPIDPDALLGSGRVAASSAPLLRGLLQVLAEDGVVQPIGSRSLWRADVMLPDHRDIWSSLIADYPEYATLAARVGAAGLHLAERLRSGGGKTAHPDGASAWAAACTQEEAADVAEALVDVVRCAAAAQSAHARLRVLWVVGSVVTERPTLFPDVDADRCDLVIGAATQAVSDDIRSRWPMTATAACHLVDLDRLSVNDIALGGGFDIVMLCEGIAAAPNPQQRLANARSLLLDDGRLVVLEQQTSRAADLVFGSDPGWWQPTESSAGASAVRARFFSPEAWGDMLAYTGFEKVEVVRDQPSAPSGPYLMIAQAAVLSRAAPASPAESRTWLLLCDATGYSADLGQALTCDLQARGQCVVTLVSSSFHRQIGPRRYALDPHDAAHWDRLFDDLTATGDAPQGWIHLAGLDLAAAAAPAAARAAAQESRASVLISWLQACARHAVRPDVWVIAAQSGTGLLPPSARSTASVALRGDGLRDAALLGIARVAMQECAEQRIRWVDLIDPLPCAGAVSQSALEARPRCAASGRG